MLAAHGSALLAIALTKAQVSQSGSGRSEGATYLTIFFSALDLEEATTAELLELLTQFLVDARVPGKWRTPSRVHPRVITDSAGEPMYTVTFVVGEPEF